MRRRKLTRPTTDLFHEGDTLDVNALHRAGAFFQPMIFPFRRLKTFPDRIEINFPKADYWHRPPEIILIERIPQHFGGTRPWFVCACGRRCAKLYVTTISAQCRHCAELGFQCQRLRRSTRLKNRAAQIRNRLDTDPLGNPKRPRYMASITYRRLIAALSRLQYGIDTGASVASPRYRRRRKRDYAGRFIA